jgi:hypothetical protein
MVIVVSFGGMLMAGLIAVVLTLNRVSVQGPLTIPGWVPAALMEGLLVFWSGWY